MEYEKVKDTCTGCGNVYSTKDDILHHMLKHHLNIVINCVLCG